MTEREYVETIRKAAEGYITFLRLNPSHTAVADEYWRWHNAKQSLSPHTAIELCDAWLKNQDNLVQTDAGITARSS